MRPFPASIEPPGMFACLPRHAWVIPLERLALSPQCGFASTWEGNRITPKVQRAKLAVVAETARKVWG